MRELGEDRGEAFFRRALEVAHSLWLQGLPAQAILLLNRAFGADLRGDEAALADFPLPYAAVAWILRSRTEDQFIGNPRRHFQHLATRMVEPRREQRSWRAWACWRLACLIFPDFPGDDRQLLEEKIVEPEFETIRKQLSLVGIPGEAELWRKVESETKTLAQ